MAFEVHLWVEGMPNDGLITLRFDSESAACAMRNKIAAALAASWSPPFSNECAAFHDDNGQSVVIPTLGRIIAIQTVPPS